MKTLWIGAAAAMMSLGIATAACAAPPGQQQSLSTPKGWNYEIKDGKRIPKSDRRVVKADGSWREEVRVGKCVTVKEKSSAGEYKEVRRCD
jgi:hypothetical protein